MADEPVVNGEAPKAEKVTFEDGIDLAQSIISAVSRVMGNQPTMALGVFMFGIHRALAGMAVVGIGMSHGRLPTDEEIEKLLILYRAHLHDARTTEATPSGPVS